MSFEKIILSIIIPVYNTELYLRECLDSLLNQGLKEYEIIIINDGSTDNSKNIILEYQKKYSFIRYFEQENSGQGTARNLGIDNALGKYIYFMDSDDYLATNKLSQMIEIMQKKDLDAIFFDGESFFHKDQKIKLEKINYKRKKKYGFYFKGELLLKELSLNNELIVSPCLYITKKKIIISNNLYFPEKYKHEDEFFTVTLFLYLEKCFHTSETVFLRRLRENSTMTISNKIPSFIGYVNVLKYFDQVYSNFIFKTNLGKRSYRKKMKQLTKAAYRAYSQVKNKQQIQNELNELNKFIKKYKYFDLLTFIYITISKNTFLLKRYTKLTEQVKKLY